MTHAGTDRLPPPRGEDRGGGNGSPPRHRRRQALAAILILLSLTLPAHAAPALFRIDGAPAPVYLFGSMHLLPPRYDWRTKTFDDALATTKAEWFEIAQAPSLTMLFDLGPAIDLSYPLHKDLTRAEFATIKATLAKAHLPVALVDHMHPWLAALTLVSLAEARETRLTTPGVDVQLMAEARTHDIHVSGLESMASLTTLLDAVPRPDQIRMLQEVIAPAPADTDSNLDIFDAWKSGDLPRLEAIGQRSRNQAPALFDALLRLRNQSWLPEIDAVLHADTPTFITVGALHLVGPDGLIAQLEHRGYHVDRIQ